VCVLNVAQQVTNSICETTMEYMRI